jgi:hypothetical protein
MIICESISTSSYLRNFSDIGYDDILNAYYANLLAACLLYRLNERESAFLLKDSSGSRLSGLRSSMSVVNFWGVALFHSDSFGNKFDNDTHAKLKRVTGYILPSSVDKIHRMVSGATSLDWFWINDGIRVLSRKLDLRTPQTEMIRAGIEKWHDFSDGDKSRILTRAYYYLNERDRYSPLTERMKHYSQVKLFNPLIKDPDQGTAGSYTNLTEDEGTSSAAVSGGASTSATTPIDPNKSAAYGPDNVQGTSSADIATYGIRLFKNKIIRRMKKKFGKIRKFKAPSAKYRAKREPMKLANYGEVNGQNYTN